MKKSDLDNVTNGLNELKKTVKKLGMPRANLHDIDIALAVVARVEEKISKQRKAS